MLEKVHQFFRVEKVEWGRILQIHIQYSRAVIAKICKEFAAGNIDAILIQESLIRQGNEMRLRGLALY